MVSSGVWCIAGGVGKGVGLRDVRVMPHECEHRDGGNGVGGTGAGPSLAPPTSGAGIGRWDRTTGGGGGIERLVGEIERLKLQNNGMHG
jgi:hypothetical protein